MKFDRSVVCPVMIGRENDLQRLDRLMTQAQEGRGQIALISGEAGIGKSRLVREAKGRVPRGTTIVEGACFQTESILPYAPLLDLFRNLFGLHPPEEIARLVEPSAAPHLLKLFPELTRYLPDLTSVVPSSPDPEQEKRRTFQALFQTLTELAQSGPLIVILEDLHWSDSTSLEFLLLLARRISTQPVLLLLTYRSEDTTPELTHFLAELDRERLSTEFALKPMSSPEVEDMLQAILDSPQTSLSGDFLDTIFALTEGNPFFIEEILKALTAEGDISFGEADGLWDRKEIDLLHIPRTIQDAVQRRTQQLDEGTLRALTLASVMGRRFNFRLLQEMLNVKEADLMAMLKKLIAAQLVVEETADHFAFRHALTRQAIYNTLLLRERQALHRSVAEVLERLSAEAGASEAQVADLSFHYYTGAVWEKALEYSRRAGDRARSFYALREAIVYYSRALVAARQLNLAREPELLSARGRAYDILGDFKSAYEDFEDALKIARQAGDVQAEWQTLTALGFLWITRDLQRAGEFFHQAEELARRLHDPGLQAHSLNHVGNWCFMTGQTLQGLKCHRQALKFFEAERDEAGIAGTRALLGMATLHHGDQIGSYEEYKHAIYLFRKLDNKPELISALVGASHTLYDETDFVPSQTRDQSLAMGREAVELARQTGWPSLEAFAEWSFALGLANWGYIAEALTHARATYRIGTEIEQRQRIAGAYYALGHIYLLMLQADLAIENLEQGATFAKEFGSAWLIGNITTDRAHAYLLKGEPGRARTLLESVRLLESGHHTRSERRMLWAKGNVLLAENKPAEALQMAEHLLESKRSSQITQPIPALLKLRGEALMAMKQWEHATRDLERAKQGAAQRETLPLLWQIQRQLGWLYQQQKDSENAQREFAGARQVVQALAANIQDEGLRAGFLHAALETLPKEPTLSRRQSEAAQFGGLTPREREVAGFLSQGKSNREIAEELVLSERTVENHIGNILTKLGFTSRAQIAVWAVEKGLGDRKN